jgi:hypothetical protein
MYGWSVDEAFAGSYWGRSVPHYRLETERLHVSRHHRGPTSLSPILGTVSIFRRVLVPNQRRNLPWSERFQKIRPGESCNQCSPVMWCAVHVSQGRGAGMTVILPYGYETWLCWTILALPVVPEVKYRRQDSFESVGPSASSIFPSLRKDA